MPWSNETDKALRIWLDPETAHTNHPSDNDHFHHFIARVWADEQGLWDEALAREKMKHAVQELHPEWFGPDATDEYMDKFIEDRLRKGTDILDFLSFAKSSGFTI